MRAFFMKRLSNAVLLISLLILGGCSVAPLEERSVAVSLPHEEILQTRLGKIARVYGQEHPGFSGVYALNNPVDAFAARIFMARAAEKTLDVQYYIWRKDLTGTMLLYELFLAAERGVRVRLLLDDLGVVDMDGWLAVLNSHANIEVRLFNPFPTRRMRMLGFVTDFSRVNRRMHNKSFTVDQSVTISGGRNVGDEYFAATDRVLFADLDVMVVGPAAAAVSEDFDRYWASQSAYPVDQLFEQEENYLSLQAEVDKILARPDSAQYTKALRQTSFAQRMLAKDLTMDWVKTRLVSDDPAKGLGPVDRSGLMIYSLESMMGQSIQKLDLVSSYFVPTEASVEVFSTMAAHGTKIRILTNALEATDVAAVHSGYAKHRKALLEAGIELYEMKRESPAANDGIASFGSGSSGISGSGGSGSGSGSGSGFGGSGGGGIGSSGSGGFGSSGSSLHAKTFSVNGKQIYVGSFNFDPRSAELNTESGFVIDSPAMAEAVDEMFIERVPQTAYQVKLDEKGNLYWLEQGDSPVIHRHDPGAGWFKRAMVKVLSWLPIEWLL
jgi:putative cardiolipin synthase